MSGSYKEKGLRKQSRKRCKRKFEKDKDKETMSGRWIKAVRKRKKRYNVWNEDTRFRKKEEEKERKRIDVKEVDIIVEKEQHIISVLSWIIA